MRRGPGTWCSAFALALLIFFTPAWAPAQPIPNVETTAPVDRNPDPRRDGMVRVVDVNLGLGSTLAVDRHGPVTVWITSGAKAWSGSLAVSHPGPSGGAMTSYVSAATTPGRVTPVEIIVQMPTRVDEMSILANGRTIARLTPLPTGRREFPISTVASGMSVIATLGDVSLARQTRESFALARLDAQASEAPAEAIWQNTRVEPIKRPPLAWIAYEQCDAVVSTSSALEALGERGRTPLLDWVRTGGHLIVINDSSSREWAFAGCADAIELADIVSVESPRSLRDTIVPDSKVDAIPAFDIRTRPVQLRDPTWRAIWPIQSQDGTPLSLGAEGPVGLGFVTVFGGDPGRWTPIASNEHALAIWRSILKEPVEQAADPSAVSWYSGERARAMAATRRWLVDQTFNASPPSPRLLSALLMLLVIGLAAVLGPVDMLLLRRLNLRHRSHRTAFAWLAAASLAAYVAPLAIRSSEDTLSRGRVSDVVLHDDGTTSQAATGATLVYAGEGTRVELDGVPDGAWCGVAGIDASYYFNQTRVGSPDLDVIQTAASDGARQGMCAGFFVGQWTFRIIEDVQPARRGPTGAQAVRVERVGDEWRVTVEGMFADNDAKVQACTLLILGRTYGVKLERVGPGRWTGYANAPFEPLGPYPSAYDGYSMPVVKGTSVYRVKLPMTVRRTRAFERYSDSEGWSVLTMLVRRDASDLTVRERDFKTKALEVIRIAVPTPEARRDAATHPDQAAMDSTDQSPTNEPSSDEPSDADDPESQPSDGPSQQPDGAGPDPSSEGDK